MQSYRIITESTTDLTPEIIRELELTVMPMTYTMDGKSYQDIPGDKNIKKYYDKLRAGSMSKTSQINPEDFISVFTPILESGEDILHIAFSSGLSGTYQSALIAKEELSKKFPTRRIEIFDSLAASMGEGLFVFGAAMQKKLGADMDELLNWLKDNVFHLCLWFTVDDLNHLKRGGRISATTAVLGTMLGIKPVMHVDNEGHLVPVSKVRGRKQSLDALVKRMEETVFHDENATVFISHGDCLDDAKYVANQIKSKMGIKDIRLNFIGPVIGAHSGPGTVALFFFGRER